MNKFKLGRDALILSIMTLITVLTWIAFEVYRIAMETTLPKITQQQMIVLSPKIRTDILESLKTNLSFTEEELNAVTPISTQSGSPQ